jgi:hypothetical protein
MFRKWAIVPAIGMLAVTAACSSGSSTTINAAGVTGTAADAVAPASPSTCPAKSTRVFAKTSFVADIALAGGAFKRWIYTPAKDGRFKTGADGKVTGLVKAAAAGAFAVGRLDAAKSAAEANPSLCRALVTPMANFRAEVNGLITKAEDGAGAIEPSDVTSGASYLSDLHDAASHGGVPFADNENTSA